MMQPSQHAQYHSGPLTPREVLHFLCLGPLFVFNVLYDIFTRWPSRAGTHLHWRQLVPIAILRATRGTFTKDQQRWMSRRATTGEGIKRYCDKHNITHSSHTLEPKTVAFKHTSSTDTEVPPPTLHFVTPPSSHTSGPTILYFHGGGYVNPMKPIGHVGFSLYCAAACKARQVVFLEYSLSPEYQYPIQLIQAVAALRYLLDEEKIPPEDIIVGGDSAGGHLTASLLAHISETSPYAAPLSLGGAQLKAALFISPWTLFSTNQFSFKSNHDKDYLNRYSAHDFLRAWNPTKVDNVWSQVCDAKDASKVWERVFPGFSRRGGLVKRALVTTGTAETLFDSCCAFGSSVVKAERVVVGDRTDVSAARDLKCVLGVAIDEVHVQPALDAAVGYFSGGSMRLIGAFLESLV